MEKNGARKSNLYFLLVFIYILIIPYILSGFYRSSDFLLSQGLVFNLIFPETVVMVPPVIAYFLVTKNKVSDVLPFKKVSIKNCISIIIISITIQPFMSVLSYVGMLFSENYISEVAVQLSEYPFLISLFTIAVVPAFLEEFLMRGTVLYDYKNVSVFKTAVINGLFFGIMHASIQQFFYASLLGFVFVYFVRLTGSILSSILAHFIINGSQISLTYLSSLNTSDTQTLDTPIDIKIIVYMAIIVLIFTSIALFVFLRFIKSNTNTQTIDVLEKDDIDINIINNNSGEKVVDVYLITTIILYVFYIVLDFLSKME